MVERVALLSLHSSPLAPPGSPDAGGMNAYVLRLADDLSRAGKLVDVFTRRADEKAPEVVTTAQGAHIVHLTAGPPRPLPKSVLPLHIPSMAAALHAYARRENRDYDVLHSHYWLSGLVALRYRDHTSAPIVHMFHTLSKVKEFYFGKPDPSDSALRPDGERCVLSGASAIVGATEQERHDIERHYGPLKGRFAVIPPGVDTQAFRPLDRAESRRSLAIGGDRVILFVGRLQAIKGLEILFRALASLRGELEQDIRLVVVGGQESRKSRERYQRQVDRLGLHEVVEFRGIVPQAELVAYYSAADLCAIPSAYESFGMVAIESMACETPVVAFRVGGLVATVVEGSTGLLASPGNAADFTAKLRQALTSVDLPEMGRHGRWSVQRFNWPTIADRTLDLYERVVHDQAGLLPRFSRG